MINHQDRPGPDAAVLAEQIAADTLAESSGGQVATTWVEGTTGYEGQILGRLRDGLAAGTIPGCDHQRSAAILAWVLAPGCPVGCHLCVLAWVLENVTGTAEDGACDICRQPREGKTERSMVFRLGLGDQALIITYYVCPGCLAVEPA